MSDQRLRDLERQHRENPNDEDVGQDLFRERLRGIDLAEFVLRRLARMERVLDQNRQFMHRYRGEISYRELNELLDRDDLDKPRQSFTIALGGIARGSGEGVGGGATLLEAQGEITLAGGTGGVGGGGGFPGDIYRASSVAHVAPGGDGAVGVQDPGSGAQRLPSNGHPSACGCVLCRVLDQYD